VDNSSIQELTELLKGICEEINYRLQQGCKKYEQPAKRKKNGTESAFPLDSSIIARLYEGKICENMNNLRSGKGMLPSGSLSPGMIAVEEIGVEDGEIIASNKGLHLYDYCWDLARMRTGRK